MGNKQIEGNKNNELRANREKISKNHFDFMYVIGRGGFGKVWKVYSKKYKKIYAMKEMAKAKIIDKKSESSIKYERELLSKIKHPFIVNMHFAFQDFDNIYIVMDYLIGGDMRYHVSRIRKFSEEQTSKHFLIIKNFLWHAFF